MKILRTIILAFCLAETSAISAHTPKEGDIWATGGPFVQRTRTSVSGATSVGGGIAAEGDVDFNGGVEIAMIYLNKLYARRGADGSLVERIKRMYITTGYRHWFNPSLSAGLAIFSSYSMGDPTVVDDKRAPGSPMLTTAHAITEYGTDFSLESELWHNDAIAVVADARFSLSLARKSGQDANTYGLLIGIQYLVPKHG